MGCDGIIGIVAVRTLQHQCRIGGGTCCWFSGFDELLPIFFSLEGGAGRVCRSVCGGARFTYSYDALLVCVL